MQTCSQGDKHRLVKYRDRRLLSHKADDGIEGFVYDFRRIGAQDVLVHSPVADSTTNHTASNRIHRANIYTLSKYSATTATSLNAGIVFDSGVIP